MTKIQLVFGTRPDAIKLGPVAAELRALGADFSVLCTGQHTHLLKGTPAETDLKDCKSLQLVSDGSVPKWLRNAERALEALWKADPPKVVVVQGDTMSALVGASAASGLGIMVAHVEAGVRSHDLDDPWPEEAARTRIAQIADWHYAPTPTAIDNLLIEGISSERVVLTGNTVVSALARYASDVTPQASPEPLAVVTLHRREIQTPKAATTLYNAIYRLAMHYPGWRIYWPLHPGFVKVLGEQAPMPPNVTLSEHMPYASFVATVAKAKVVITDSGGLVEEATTLGVPSVILRATNDRPEAVVAGLAVMATPASLALAVQRAVMLERKPSATFGGADAALRVATHLANIVATN